MEESDENEEEYSDEDHEESAGEDDEEGAGVLPDDEHIGSSGSSSVDIPSKDLLDWLGGH